jgi:hypothetical protein
MGMLNLQFCQPKWYFKIIGIERVLLEFRSALPVRVKVGGESKRYVG